MLGFDSSIHASSHLESGRAKFVPPDALSTSVSPASLAAQAPSKQSDHPPERKRQKQDFTYSLAAQL